MSDDKDSKLSQELDLRDSFAMAALPGLIYRMSRKEDSPDWSYLNSDEPGAPWKRTEACKEEVELIATYAYMIADEMRKARLRSFE